MATDYAIRSNLVNKGIADSDINYDQNTGYVQVKGQNFIKPDMNVQGTTYTSQDNFNNAYNQYNKQQQSNQLQQSTNQYINNVNQGPAANPYNDQYSQMIKDIMSKVNAPQQDVYSTPQYAAAQAQQQRAAQQGIRSAQESLGSAGFGRSLAMGETANRVQNDANEYLKLQMVPQIQQQLAAQRQNEINSQMALLNPVFNQLSRQDTLDRNKNADIMSVIELLNRNGQQDLTNKLALNQDARSEAGVTGNYLPNGAKDIINQVLGLKQQAEGQGVTSDQMGQYRNQADGLRSQLAQMGVDPNMVGFENDYSQASQNAANYKGNRTLEGQVKDFNQQLDTEKFNYGKEQDAIQNTAQYSGMYNDQPTMQKIMQEATLKNMNSDNVRAAASEARQVGKDVLGNLFDVWDRTGEAPSGIPGVPQGTRLAGANIKPMTTESAINTLNKSSFISEETTTDKYGNVAKTGKMKIEKPGMVQAIAGLNLPDDQMDALFNYYGISESEVQEIEKQLQKQRQLSGN